MTKSKHWLYALIAATALLLCAACNHVAPVSDTSSPEAISSDDTLNNMVGQQDEGHDEQTNAYENSAEQVTELQPDSQQAGNSPPGLVEDGFDAFDMSGSEEDSMLDEHPQNSNAAEDSSLQGISGDEHSQSDDDSRNEITQPSHDSLPPDPLLPIGPNEPADGPIVLSIFGSGVSEETAWALNQLISLSEGYRENTYSTTNNWPAYAHVTAHGVSIPYLLRQAGLLEGASSIKFSASDGYHFTLTFDQVFGNSFAFASHSSSESSGATIVEPIIAWEWGTDGNVREESIRAFFGQSGPNEVNTSAFVSNLISIEVSMFLQEQWSAPEFSIEDGSSVPFGFRLELLHENMDNIKIYYTLDGSDPDYNSMVYNRSTSYFQPHLTVPLVITESGIINAFAAGLGRSPSQIVSISFFVY